MRRALVLPVGVVMLAALDRPSRAGGTTTTANLSGGGLSIAAATSVTLSGAAAGASSLTGSLGTVTVTDTRGAPTAVWTATVTATSFTTGLASADETVSPSSITYSSGPGSAASGQVGTMVPSSSVTLGSSRVAASWSGIGNNTVSWSPTLTFALKPSQVRGTYTGTVTHSVS